MEPVFNIKHLHCEYIKDVPVLELNDLTIPRGKLIFVIGKSGIGKSTFIETLGLMNKTIAEREQTSITFYPKNGDAPIELKNSWQQPNASLSNFRKSHFSFIFQNTNLMPNFTAGQNMMMSLLIKGKSVNEAKEEVLRVMKRLSLPEYIFDKKITELSGGQRQRLAFVRAVTADFTVLFGDEPTGNLDEHTANELMSILKQLIQEEQKTGIIVSHDLKLASRFADWVVPITTQADAKGQLKGVVKNENILRHEKETWQMDGRIIKTDPVQFLSKYLETKVLDPS